MRKLFYILQHIQSRRIKYIALFIILSTASFWYTQQRNTLLIHTDQLIISEVTEGVFQDNIPVRATVMPVKTVYLDTIEGGRITRIHTEEGTTVKTGQPILELVNPSIQLEVVSREAQLSEQLNNLHHTQLEVEQARFSLHRDLAELDYKITQLKRQFEQREKLFSKRWVAEEDLLRAKDEYLYTIKKRAIIANTYQQEEKIRQNKLIQLKESVSLMKNSLTMARSKLEELVIKAPIDGKLTSLDATLGETKASGIRIGQIDVLDDFKLQANIDEFYANRIELERLALATLDGQHYPLIVSKIYAQIRERQFVIDLTFTKNKPLQLKRGQTLPIYLQIGQAQRAILLPKGSFFQDTGGSWIFLLNKDSTKAHRKSIHLGRHNNDYYEVVSGLQAGDKVITSSYGAINEIEVLKLSVAHLDN